MDMQNMKIKAFFLLHNCKPGVLLPYLWQKDAETPVFCVINAENSNKQYCCTKERVSEL